MQDLRCNLLDDYDHVDDNLEYILENILSEEVLKQKNDCEESKQLNELFNTLLLNKCECSEIHKQQCSKCSHGGNYIFNEEYQELVLNDFKHIPELIYECSYKCLCETIKCQNRLVQHGPRNFLKIVYSPKYLSKGLITLREIPKGAFICEYAGELLTRQEAKKIITKNEIDHKMNYVLFLKESCLSPPANSTKSNENFLITIVNPSNKGNIGRYLNHSCDPNCHIISVRIDCPIPKIAFFSIRNIKAGEEICFNYNEGANGTKMENISTTRIPCLCGSKNCSKYLPNSEYT